MMWTLSSSGKAIPLLIENEQQPYYANGSLNQFLHFSILFSQKCSGNVGKSVDHRKVPAKRALEGIDLKWLIW